MPAFEPPPRTRRLSASPRQPLSPFSNLVLLRPCTVDAKLLSRAESNIPLVLYAFTPSPRSSSTLSRSPRDRYLASLAMSAWASPSVVEFCTKHDARRRACVCKAARLDESTFSPCASAIARRAREVRRASVFLFRRNGDCSSPLLRRFDWDYITTDARVSGSRRNTRNKP